MIFVDANILLYAEDQTSPFHQKIVAWWDEKLSGTDPVCLSWPVILAFIRISTNHRIFKSPLSIKEATEKVNSWLAQPPVRIVETTSQHWAILQNLLEKGQAKAGLATDAHLAALAIENGCTLYSTDNDFSRFTELSWKNPLVKK